MGPAGAPDNHEDLLYGRNFAYIPVMRTFRIAAPATGGLLFSAPALPAASALSCLLLLPRPLLRFARN
jgi:hypothetical protein